MKKNLLILLLAFSVNVFGQIPINGLVSYFPFNGNANDHSEYSKNVTVQGAILTKDRFGNENSAYYFNGNSRIIIQPDTILDINKDISLCAWVKVDTIDHPGVMLWRGNELDGLDPYGLGFWSNTLNFFRDISFNQSANVSYAIDNAKINNYQFIVGTFNYVTGDMKLYINSLLVNTNNTPYLCKYPTNDYYNVIGNVDVYHSDLGFNGTIDDVRIYNRVLSDDEIQNIFRIESVTSYSAINTTNNIIIYPNPTSNLINIDFNENRELDAYRISLTTLTGQTVFIRNIYEQKNQIKLNGLKGIYFLQIIDKSNKTVEIRKLLVQ